MDQVNVDNDDKSIIYPLLEYICPQTVLKPIPPELSPINTHSVTILTYGRNS